MALSFDVRLTWELFWENQQNNPNCELAFQYKNKIYFLYYDNYQRKAWGIYESGITPECRGRDAFGKCLAENIDENPNNPKCSKDEEWKSIIDSCLKVLTMPIWEGKSFRDVIKEILFEN